MFWRKKDEPAPSPTGAAAFIASIGKSAEERRRQGVDFHSERMAATERALNSLMDTVRMDPRFLGILADHNTDLPVEQRAEFEQAVYGDVLACTLKVLAKMYGHQGPLPDDIVDAGKKITQLFIGWSMVYAGYTKPSEDTLL